LKEAVDTNALLVTPGRGSEDSPAPLSRRTSRSGWPARRGTRARRAPALAELRGTLKTGAGNVRPKFSATPRRRLTRTEALGEIDTLIERRRGTALILRRVPIKLDE